MKYKSGDDYKDYDADYPTYGISCGNHTNKIEVYGDAKLRDEILDFLLATQGDDSRCPTCGGLIWPDGKEFDYTP